MSRTILALCSLLPEEMKDLEDHFNVLRLSGEGDPERALRDHSQDIVGIVSNMHTPVTERLIEVLPNLEIISQFAVGVDNIDLQAAARRGVMVTNTPDVLTADTADTALALLLSVSRRICEADMYVRFGKWPEGVFGLGTALAGKKAGIIGLGRIGRAIAKRLEAFDIDVCYHGRSQKDDVEYKFYANLGTMAADVDYLIAACPGGEETKHIVNLDILEALGSKGFLVNIARGSVVKEDDLLIALANKTIAGAGLDVYEDEPNVPEAFFKMDNVVLLPHIGSATRETRAAMGRLVVDNLKAHFEGIPLKTPVAA